MSGSEGEELLRSFHMLGSARFRQWPGYHPTPSTLAVPLLRSPPKASLWAESLNEQRTCLCINLGTLHQPGDTASTWGHSMLMGELANCRAKCSVPVLQFCESSPVAPESADPVLRPRDCLIAAKQWQVIAWGKQCSSQRAFRSPRTIKRNRKSPCGDLAAPPPNRPRSANGVSTVRKRGPQIGVSAFPQVQTGSVQTGSVRSKRGQCQVQTGSGPNGVSAFPAGGRRKVRAGPNGGQCLSGGRQGACQGTKSEDSAK